MNETVVGLTIGFASLIVAIVVAAGHYRIEHLRNRAISRMRDDRFCDCGRPTRD